MDFFEAMQMMKKGKAVRLKSWSEDHYIGLKEEEVKVFGEKKIKYTIVNEDENNVSPLLSFSELVLREWECN